MSRSNPLLMVRANGRSLTAEEPLLTKFEHRELGDGGKEAVITIANASLDLVDDPDFQEDVDVEWRFGYPGNLTATYKSTVYVTEPTFDAFGGVTLRLYAYDAVLARLFGKRQRVWRKKDEAKITRSEVIEMLAEELGIEAKVEPTKGLQESFAQNGPDWEFIQKLASESTAENPSHAGAYRAWFDSESQTLHFAPAPFYNKPKKTYRYLTDPEDPSLLTFAPRINTTRPDGGGGTSTTAGGTNGNGEEVRETRTGEDAERVRGGRMFYDAVASVKEKFPDAPDVVGEFLEVPDANDPTAEDGTEADRANTNVANEELDTIEAQITLIGDPTIRANDIIEIRGVGQKLSGNYLCDEVTHHINSEGFTTEILGKLGQLPGDVTGDGTEAGGTEGGAEDADGDGYAETVEMDAENIEKKKSQRAMPGAQPDAGEEETVPGNEDDASFHSWGWKELDETKAVLAASAEDPETKALIENAESWSELDEALGYEPRPVLVLDPGHGGSEAPGATNGDVLEKDLNLAQTKAIATALGTGPADLRLTRFGDNFPSFADRVNNANAAGAEAFVSVHHDTAAAPGAGVYHNGTPEGIELANRLASRLGPDAWVRSPAEAPEGGLYIENFYGPGVLLEMGPTEAVSENVMRTRAEGVRTSLTEWLKERRGG